MKFASKSSLPANPQCVNYRNFSVTQILREIKVGKSKVSKSSTLADFEALNFSFYNFCTIWWLMFTKINKIQSLWEYKN